MNYNLDPCYRHMRVIIQVKKEKDSMRVLILGIDALEYNRVEEWDLKHLKQVEYGRTIVPLTNVKGENEPATVVVWPCFIT